MKEIYNVVELTVFDNNVNIDSIKSYNDIKDAQKYLNDIILYYTLKFPKLVYDYDYDNYIDFLPDKYGVLKCYRIENSELH